MCGSGMNAWAMPETPKLFVFSQQFEITTGSGAPKLFVLAQQVEITAGVVDVLLLLLSLTSMFEWTTIQCFSG